METQPHWIEFFDKHKKKDDLADTYMQAMSYTVPEIEAVAKGVRPRKPTENQSRTKYSRANLAWIVVQKKHKTDKRFEKDLKRYYNSLEELAAEFSLVLN